MTQTVLITGASKGIGKNLVEYFKEKDWTVAACSKSKDWISDSQADFNFICDVSKKEHVIDGIKSVVDKFGKFDVLINNAGIAGNNPIEPDSSDALWHQIIDTNLNGVYHMCKYGLPHINDNTGRIINISSVLGIIGVPDQSAYSVSKHAIIGLTKSLAMYVAPRKITVNAICPSWVNTEMMKKRIETLSLSLSEIQESIPLSNVIQPKEISAFAYFLSSPEASNITGQSIIIDGGHLLNLS